MHQESILSCAYLNSLVFSLNLHVSFYSEASQQKLNHFLKQLIVLEIPEPAPQITREILTVVRQEAIVNVE